MFKNFFTILCAVCTFSVAAQSGEVTPKCPICPETEFKNQPCDKWEFTEFSGESPLLVFQLSNPGTRGFFRVNFRANTVETSGGGKFEITRAVASPNSPTQIIEFANTKLHIFYDRSRLHAYIGHCLQIQF